MFGVCIVVGHVVTGSWDKTVRCWDPRGGKGVGTYSQPERVYSMSLVGHRLVVATAGRHITVYDLRHMQQAEQIRESSLKYQTRCVRCYPNGTGMRFNPLETFTQTDGNVGVNMHDYVYLFSNFLCVRLFIRIFFGVWIEGLREYI